MQQDSCHKMTEKSSSFVTSDMDLQVFRGNQLSSMSSNHTVQDTVGKGAFATVTRCIKIKPLERRKRAYAQISQNNRSSASTSPERRRRRICGGTSPVKRSYGEISQGSHRIAELSSPERKKKKICGGGSPVKRPYGEISQGSHRIAEICSPERKERTICGGRSPVKRPYSEISQSSHRIAELSSPERKKKKICGGGPPVKRPYGEISQSSHRMTEICSQERKERKSCGRRCPVKRPYSEISQSSHRTAEISSPERKRRRMTMDTEEKVIELPSTSKEAPCTMVKVICTMRREVTSSGTRNPDTMYPPKRKEDWKVTERVSNIWIIGDSYVRRGQEAAHENFGKNFGLNANVQWFGKGGMRWSGVLPRFYDELASQSPPDILVLHAGGNDLGLMSSQELVSVMQRDLMQLHTEFPSMKIAFSFINERQKWRNGKPWKINNDRKMVNSCMRKNVGNLGGKVIEHPFLRYFDRKIFLPDKVHFTKHGNHVFLTSIHCSLKKILQRSSLKQYVC